MPSVGYIQGTVWEDTTPYLMARVVGATAEILTRSDISSVSYTVVDIDDNTTVVASGSPSKDTVFFNSLQTDARWTKDSTGYNFAFALPATALPNGQQTYVVDFQITP